MPFSALKAVGEDTKMQTGKNNKTLSWIKRIEPFQDESLAGFLGRWSHENVLHSRLNLLAAIGVSRAIRVTPSDISDLADALGIDRSILDGIAPSTNPCRPALRRAHTRPTTEAICPHCLAEVSYSRQLWSHVLATACPTHGTRLIDRCQHCSNDIQHDRQLPHLCNCGADLRKQSSIEATEAEVALSIMLMGDKPNSEVLPFELHSGVPAELDLFVLGMANHFGNPVLQNKVGKSPLPRSVDQALAKLMPLFELLECWPSKFDSRLEEMLSLAPKGVSTGAAARAGRWYTFLFRTYQHLEAFQPLRIATANAIVRLHDGVLNGRTSGVIGIATIEKNWYSVKEASVELHVSADCINDGIDRCLIRAQIHDEAVGYRQRFIARAEIERLRNLQFEHINDTYAMSILQVPKSIFRLMCESGWIIRADKSDVAPVVSGYIKHVPLLDLIERLRISVQQNVGTYVGSTVQLHNLNLRRTTDLQKLIALFRAIAAGEIIPVGHDDALSIGSMSFSQKDVDKRIASWFVARGLTLEQVSDLSGAHYDAVKEWVEMGLLAATKEPLEHGSPWVINLRDFTNFLQTYLPLAKQANDSNSSTRGLVTRLKRIKVNAIETPHGRGALVKLQDVWRGLDGCF